MLILKKKNGNKPRCISEGTNQERGGGSVEAKTGNSSQSRSYLSHFAPECLATGGFGGVCEKLLRALERYAEMIENIKNVHMTFDKFASAYFKQCLSQNAYVSHSH